MWTAFDHIGLAAAIVRSKAGQVGSKALAPSWPTPAQRLGEARPRSPQTGCRWITPAKLDRGRPERRRAWATLGRDWPKAGRKRPDAADSRPGEARISPRRSLHECAGGVWLRTRHHLTLSVAQQRRLEPKWLQTPASRHTRRGGAALPRRRARAPRRRERAPRRAPRARAEPRRL